MTVQHKVVNISCFKIVYKCYMFLWLPLQGLTLIHACAQCTYLTEIANKAYL